MAPAGLPVVSALQVEGILFPAAVKPPGSSTTLFLGGAGVRGLDINGEFVKFTAIGVYLGDAAVVSLAAKWKGKSTPEQLACSEDFFLDVVRGPYEKFTNVTLIATLTGEQYSDKVAENCVAIWKAAGTYTDAEVQAMEEFKAAFAGRVFPPGSSILLAESSSGTLTIAFSDDGTVPEAGDAVIESRAMAEAFLESVIGQNGVSPAAKKSLAARVSDLLKEHVRQHVK